MNNSLG